MKASLQTSTSMDMKALVTNERQEGEINMIHLDLADLHQGLYMLRINYDGQGLIHQKLTIMN